MTSHDGKAWPDVEHPLGQNPALAEGITLFNSGQYYACHDALEAIWMEASTPEKPFYQGILQIAVGLYHLGNHNWRGAMTLLGEGVNRLRRFEPHYYGVDVARLVDCGWTWLMALNALGEDQVATLAAVIQPSQVQLSTAAQTESQPEVALMINGERVTLPVLYLFASDHPH